MKKTVLFFLLLTIVTGLFAGCAGTPVIYYSDCTWPADSHTGTPSTPTVTEGALKTGLAILASAKGSENATQADYDVTLAAGLVDDNGVIQDCIIDSIGTKVTFDVTGTLTADLAVRILTKNELGDDYGMLSWGGAIAERYQQAATFAAYVTGKTAPEVGGIAVSEGKPADADLSSSVTIGFQKLINKAMAL